MKECPHCKHRHSEIVLVSGICLVVVLSTFMAYTMSSPRADYSICQPPPQTIKD